MNILFIENSGNKNAGAFRSLIALIKNLELMGCDCFVALPDKADGTELLQERNIQYITMRECAYVWMMSNSASTMEYIKMPFKDLVIRRASKKIATFIKENQIDIIHENTSACYIGYFVAKKLHVKHVWHIREFIEEDFNSHIWQAKRAYKMMSDSDAVIAISKAIAEKYKNLIDERKLKIIYNGITISDFYSPDKKIFDKCKSDDGKCENVQLLCAGRICSGKGQEDLIRALGVLKERYDLRPKVSFAGTYTNDILESYMMLAERLGISSQIKFLGQVNDMKSLYADADIYCMTSKCEAFGRVTVEAMLSGNLVIGSNSGGTPEILDNGIYGLLYSPSDCNDLAEKIAYSCKHQDEMSTYASRAREHAKKTFDSWKNAENIMKLYQDIMR